MSDEGARPSGLAGVSILSVWSTLGGGELRRGRGRAFWRDGDGFHVALDETKGAFFDHARGEGGGVLRLVEVARNFGRREALAWLEQQGLIEPRQMTVTERRAHAEARRRDAVDLPSASYWRRTFTDMCDEVLALEKAKLFDPTAGPADTALISSLTARRAAVYAASGAGLLSAYREFRAASPRLCGGMVKWARERERLELLALDSYLAEAFHDA